MHVGTCFRTSEIVCQKPAKIFCERYAQITRAPTRTSLHLIVQSNLCS